MKRQLRKEYKRRVKLILSSKLHGRNKVMAVNTWAVAMLRYGGGVLKWTTEEVDGKTGKVMTMYGALHRKSDINSLYTDAKRKRCGGGVKLLKMYPGRGDQCWMVGLEQQWGAVAEDSENIWSGTFGSSRRRSEIMEGKENAWTVAEAIGKRGF